ncbi:putative nuclease HARBI1 [Heptranchias perlo]|uniref:putative nuclease HARBI1 n=1 Tax=Heptranchias perlo TaxID=212740 RepID=UPI00355A02B7
MTYLDHLLQPQLEPRTRAWTALPVAVKISMALNVYATDSFQAAAGDISDIIQFVVHHCIREVTETLYTRRRTFISFPMDRVKQDERALGSAHIAGFPKVQGGIDRTCFALLVTYHQSGMFLNRKGFHAFNVQLICDLRQHIMQFCARFPGHSHASFIVRQSSVPPLFQPGCQVTGWQPGNKGYTLQIWLMTPVRNPGTAAEVAYNESHAATRNIIKQMVGLLKQCFSCLHCSWELCSPALTMFPELWSCAACYTTLR